MHTLPPLHPVILCGGDGTRLWPASRKALPKQFMPLHGTTLFKETLLRSIALPNVSSPVVICNNGHRFLAAAQIQELLEERAPTSKTPDILLEPFGRNTAPAIALAALHLQKDDALLLVLPSDHAMKQPNAFYQAVERGLPAAMEGKLVTFGIVPDRPETGYGYIQQGAAYGSSGSVYTVERFVEKPDAATAARFLHSGGYMWNSGMFLFRAKAYLDELKAYAPQILEACQKAYAKHVSDLDFLRIDATAFEESPSDSIDYAVMEHTKKACVVPLDTLWSDLGSWESLYSIEKHDALGNAINGDVVAEECSGNFILSQSRLVAALGVKDLVIVETPDAVMVANKDKSQEVKKIVASLKAQGRHEWDLHSRVYRPWGYYESLIIANRFQVKRIVVTPGQQLSLQRHYHRAEHWVVVKGTALVQINQEEHLLSEDQSTYIPLGSLHRLMNPGKFPLEIIEIQTGSYLGEDDIERLEDKYGR